jgi:hypothetical protein
LESVNCRLNGVHRILGVMPNCGQLGAVGTAETGACSASLPRLEFGFTRPLRCRRFCL